MSDNTLRSEKWRRLERVIKWTGLSINSFALTIGLKRSENLYQIKKGNNGISRDLAELITAKYPSVSKGWLLTGEGEMLIGNKAVTGSGSGIPYYGMDATVAVEQQLPPPLFYINVPIFNDCDLSAMALGTAMQPDIPAGQHRAAEKMGCQSRRSRRILPDYIRCIQRVPYHPPLGAGGRTAAIAAKRRRVRPHLH